MTVGIIGYGRFGSLAASLIAREAKVVVYDRRRVLPGTLPAGVVRGSLQQVASQRVVILAVPVSSLQSILEAIRSFVKPGSLFIDVCAVKKLPIRWMKAMLPRTVEILGTHPLFGPDSCEGNVKGLRVVMCPVRGDEKTWRTVRRVLTRKGVVVSEMPPDAHDRMVARTVFLTQSIGRMLTAAHLAEESGGTVHFGHLRSIANVAARDSEQLFLDMYRYNPHARTMVQTLGAAWERLGRKLRKVIPPE